MDKERHPTFMRKKQGLSNGVVLIQALKLDMISTEKSRK